MKILKKSKILSLFLVACLSLSIFTVYPTNYQEPKKRDYKNLIIFSSIVATVVIIGLVLYCSKATENHKNGKKSNNKSTGNRTVTLEVFIDSMGQERDRICCEKIPDFYSCKNNMSENLAKNIYDFAPAQIKRLVDIREYNRKPHKSSYMILQGSSAAERRLVCKAIAKRLGVKYHYFNCRRIEKSNIFSEIRKKINTDEQCIVVFDGVDKLVRKGDDPDTAIISKAFGSTLDRYENNNIGIIFTVDDTWRLGESITERIFIRGKILPPTPEERESIIKCCLNDKKFKAKNNIKYVPEDLDWKLIRSKTDGLSREQLKKLVNIVYRNCVTVQESKKNKHEKVDEKYVQEELVISNDFFDVGCKFIKENIKKSQKPWFTKKCFRRIGFLCAQTFVEKFIETTIKSLFCLGCVFLKEKFTNKKTNYQYESWSEKRRQRSLLDLQ